MIFFFFSNSINNKHYSLKVFSVVNKMIKKKFASRNTYELVNNRTMRVQTSSWRSSYEQLSGCIFSTIND